MPILYSGSKDRNRTVVQVLGFFLHRAQQNYSLQIPAVVISLMSTHPHPHALDCKLHEGRDVLVLFTFEFPESNPVPGT